jgi:hypothetical protein
MAGFVAKGEVAPIGHAKCDICGKDARCISIEVRITDVPVWEGDRWWDESHAEGLVTRCEQHPYQIVSPTRLSRGSLPSIRNGMPGT